MEIQKFIEISKDKHIDDYQKMDNKYKKDLRLLHYLWVINRL